MYNPPHFKGDCWKELVDAFPLSTLISFVDQGFQISHIPVFLEGDQLFAHFARANEHWKHLANPTKVLIHGPNVYVSPTWYEKCDVPTWNYVVAHLEVEASFLSREETVEGLRKCSERMEGANGWAFEIPEDLKKLDAIVGVKFRVKTSEVKFKCSQNRSAEDFAGVQAGLRQRGGALDAVFLEWMQKIK